MAGSFNFFRRYEKAALAALAIMAMLAFFVLPPVLQMGGGGPAAGDKPVVTWKGGQLLESGLQRQVIARRALNQFLMALQAAATGNDRVQPPLRDDERAVVESLLLAREAEANGLVVSDAVINEFLGIWTGDRVRTEQIEGVVEQLRSRVGITEQDIFTGLRTLLLGERMQALALRGTGFAGSPPGWRWDAFRKLEQSATVEVAPVVVETLAGEVAEPSTAALEALYRRHELELPRARSSTPGFREPARIRYDALVATPDVFVAEAEKDVSDEQIATFYEGNKDALFKKVEPAKDAGDGKAEAEPPAAGDAAKTEPAAEKTPEAAKPEAAYEPLEKVRDDIRKRLAREAADRKVGEIFDTVSGLIGTYADDLELAIGLGKDAPQPPDVDALAAAHGLQAVRSDFVDAGEAIGAGGVGSSFQLAFSQQFGVRQQPWADMMFSPQAVRWRAVVTRDIAGNRYLSWKTEDRGEFTPPFPEIRKDVERVWRLMEARPLAKKRAEEIASSAAGKDKALAEAVAGRDGIEATTVGPFTWLTRGTAPFGAAPVISQPDGLQMPGESFMQAVFGLEPGGTAVAFNEPQTICYAIRLASYEPAEDTLRERFMDAATDPRRLVMLAEDETRDVRDRWIEGIEKRYGVEWKRDPR